MTGKKSVKFACAESRRLVRADTALWNIAPPRAAERTAYVRLVDSDGFSRYREVLFKDRSGRRLVAKQSGTADFIRLFREMRLVLSRFVKEAFSLVRDKESI